MISHSHAAVWQCCYGYILPFQINQVVIAAQSVIVGDVFSSVLTNQRKMRLERETVLLEEYDKRKIRNNKIYE